MSSEKAGAAQKTAGKLPGVFRQAVIKDAKTIQSLIKTYADRELMLPRSLNELYETIRQYIIYEEDGRLIGVCGLQVAWEDLAEIRALAVDPEYAGRGIGATLVEKAIDEARRIGIPKVFCLTYVPKFFKRLGFEVVEKHEFPHKIWSDCVRCHKFPDCDETGMARLVDPA
ncbi:MAG: N-acetyltransferase [Nitrospinae bacterium]|nr:N-acetyltransferase [Nitrospinota bacterium]